MHWIRVERYWEGEFPDVRLKFRPVLCQQCDAAPCEPVCPTYASHHTEEGLNAQVYNRCIGTRYCANACPYNVRFFNFFNPVWDKPLHLQLNPDVSVREVGVMEKCTFCVQRISAARDPGEGRQQAARGRRSQAGVRPVVPGEGAGVRRPERSGERRLAAVALASRQQAARRSRDAAQDHLSRRESRHERDRPTVGSPTTCCARCSPRRRGSICSSRFSARLSLTGLGTWLYQIYRGFGVTGIRWPVFWAFYVTNFVFWIGISHAGTLISAILRLVNARWRRPVTRCAEAITVFALMIGAHVPDHPPRPAVAVLLADSVSEPARNLAEFPLAAGLGLLRDLRPT